MPERDTENTTLERQNESLPSLFSRLTDELTQLFDAKLDLLKAELKEEVSAYTVGVLLIVAGAVIAIVGFILLNVAIAFLISMLSLARYPAVLADWCCLLFPPLRSTIRHVDAHSTL